MSTIYFYPLILFSPGHKTWKEYGQETWEWMAYWDGVESDEDKSKI